MKKVLLSVLLAVSVAVTTSVAVLPDSGIAASSELDKVNAQLKKLQEQMKATQAAEKKAQQEIERIRGFKEAGILEVARLENEIAVTSEKIANINKQMTEV